MTQSATIRIDVTAKRAEAAARARAKRDERIAALRALIAAAPASIPQDGASARVEALRSALAAGIVPGVIVYKGPSLMDGAPIAVIATNWIASQNGKTGDMVQSFILRSDMRPMQALRSGEDRAICGDCGHRPRLVASASPLAIAAGNSACYVNVGQSPTSVYDAMTRGSYIDASNMTETEFSFLFSGYNVRMGTYGDPGAAPHIWRAIVARATSRTGYTHQYDNGTVAEALRDICMASADSEAEAERLRAAGWRTFRVAPAVGWHKMKGEALCPASKEAGAVTSCDVCGLCSGAAGKGRASIMIPDHSPAGRAQKARAEKLAA